MDNTERNLQDFIFGDGDLQEFIKSKITDPWVNTPFEGYTYLHNSAKGNLGEKYAEKVLRFNGLDVRPAEKSTSGYDRFVNDKKCEIKFSLATRNSKDNTKVDKDSFVINHVSKDKDWDFLLFIGINPEPNDPKIIWFKKEDFRNNFSACFNVQQGGKKIDNDDYMCTKINELRKCEWAHEGIESLKEIMFT